MAEQCDQVIDRLAGQNRLGRQRDLALLVDHRDQPDKRQRTPSRNLLQLMGALNRALVQFEQLVHKLEKVVFSHALHPFSAMKSPFRRRVEAHRWVGQGSNTGLGIRPTAIPGRPDPINSASQTSVAERRQRSVSSVRPVMMSRPRPASRPMVTAAA